MMIVMVMVLLGQLERKVLKNTLKLLHRNSQWKFIVAKFPTQQITSISFMVVFECPIHGMQALGRSPSYTHVEPHDNGVTDVGSGAIGSGNTILDIDNLLGLSVAFDSDADGHGFDDSGSQTVTIGKADTKATKKQFQALTRDPPITFGHVHASDSGPQVKLASHQQRSHDSAGGVGALIRLPTGESNADIDSGTGRDTGANSDLMLLASSKGKLDWFQMEVTAQEFAHSQLLKARELFSAGMFTDPQHGPLYHAYGNMEMVRMYSMLFFA